MINGEKKADGKVTVDRGGGAGNETIRSNALAPRRLRGIGATVRPRGENPRNFGDV